ncbi:hypothetical protein HanXRQr2_Chr14g0670191 [Helianthus annuus]|uniref:Uncharacterized protein n=1 Tax=Helianthus annuus TaxID=4232 RepID=A0A9K3H8B2_HELAN|nr:hypothetical protein HanXRQr2_Chr14g0670191 [Helianthus annuus]KAJ0842577.1 hypothetical protein HanPSC8_Chr14g0643271 [Helianthus annuus]
MNSEEKSGGRAMAGRWWNVMAGVVAETVLMYLPVAPVSYGAVSMRMMTESEGCDGGEVVERDGGGGGGDSVDVFTSGAGFIWCWKYENDNRE